MAYAASLSFLVLVTIPAFSVWRVVSGLRTGGWHRPGWFAHAAWATGWLTALAWLRGLLAAGLDSERTCVHWHHQPFDAAYREARRDDWFRLFPLSNKCNAHYDLVPAWVNPAIAVFFLLFVVSVVGLGWTTTLRLRRRLHQERRRPR